MGHCEPKWEMTLHLILLQKYISILYVCMYVYNFFEDYNNKANSIIKMFITIKKDINHLKKYLFIVSTLVNKYENKYL